MIGTLGKVWPWKETLTWRTNSSGQQVPLLEQNLSPFSFEQVTGQPALLAYAITAMLIAMTLIWGLEKTAKQSSLR